MRMERPNGDDFFGVDDEAKKRLRRAMPCRYLIFADFSPQALVFPYFISEVMQ
jgi:hypothetical protein